MRKHLMNHLGMALFIFLALTGTFLWMSGALHFGAEAYNDSAHSEDDGHGHGAPVAHSEEDGDGHGGAEASHSATESCTDASGACTDTAKGPAVLAALEQKTCEHNIRTLDCNECRYELGVVKVEPRIAKTLLATAQVEERPVGQIVRLTGQVQQDPARVVDVTSLGAGKVIKVTRTLGDRVKEGELLAVVRSSEFGEAKAAYLEANVKLQVARRTLEREKGLFEKQISGEADYLDAQKEFISAEATWAAAEKRLHLFGLDEQQIARISPTRDNGEFADLAIRAPRAGQIVALNVTEGKVIETAHALFTIADLSNVWVWADLYEQDIAAIHQALQDGKGASATVRVGAFPQEAFAAMIDLLGSQVDEHTRTLKVRLQVPNTHGKLLPGMFANVETTLGSGEKTLLVPHEAVLSDEGKSFAFQYWKEDFWVRRDLKLGRRYEEFVEVLDGLPVGTLVASKGAFMLKSDVLRAKMGAGCAD